MSRKALDAWVVDPCYGMHATFHVRQWRADRIELLIAYAIDEYGAEAVSVHDHQDDPGRQDVMVDDMRIGGVWQEFTEHTWTQYAEGPDGVLPTAKVSP